MTNNTTIIVTRRWALQSKSDWNDQKGANTTSKKVPMVSDET